MGNRVVNPRKEKVFDNTFYCIYIVRFGDICKSIWWICLFYPYENINDGYMQAMISEWVSPDIKIIGQLIIYFLPFLFSFYLWH